MLQNTTYNWKVSLNNFYTETERLFKFQSSKQIFFFWSFSFKENYENIEKWWKILMSLILGKYSILFP